MRPVDCHCHLDFEKFDSDREEVIERCRNELKFAVTAGTDLESNREALKLEDKNSDIIKSNLGLHPTYEDSFDDVEKVKEQIRANKPIAIGEIGLDHYHIKEGVKRREQEEVFNELLKLAEELSKPVVVHSRDAEQKTVELIERYDIPEVLLHCFNGSSSLARTASQKGMTIGVTTQVLYSKRVQKVVESLELKDIVLETDSPFLYRGSRNEPVNVTESAEKIADIKGVKYEDVVRETTKNAERIFG